MDAAVTPVELKHRLAAFPPPTLIDVRRQPAFEQDPEIIPGALRRLPEDVDAWLNPDPANLAASYAILDNRPRPYYEHRLAA